MKGNKNFIIILELLLLGGVAVVAFLAFHFKETEWFPFLCVIGIFFVIIGVCIVRYIDKRFISKTAKSFWETIPEQHSQAKLIAKNVQTSSKYVPGYDNQIFQSDHLTFEFTDKTRKVLQVNNNVFNILLEGDEGILFYKENGQQLLYVDFKPQS